MAQKCPPAPSRPLLCVHFTPSPLLRCACHFVARGRRPAATTLRGQSQEEADRKSSGCITCHTATDEPTMHPSKAVHLGCTDCHGGNSTAAIVSRHRSSTSPEYARHQRKSSRTTSRSRVQESLRDSRARLHKMAEGTGGVHQICRIPAICESLAETCGSAGCHPNETHAVSTNMMTHSGFLWGAALYNNGGIPYKNTRFGESYDRDGTPQSLKTIPPPTAEETRNKGVLPELTPLYRWEQSQPGNILRVFEQGGEKESRTR